LRNFQKFDGLPRRLRDNLRPAVPLPNRKEKSNVNQPFQITRHTLFGDLPEYLTVDECRTYLGLSRGLCYDLLRRGLLPSVKFGRLIRVPKAALEPPTPKPPARSIYARAL